jgi:hypothetical protein
LSTTTVASAGARTGISGWTNPPCMRIRPRMRFSSSCVPCLAVHSMTVPLVGAMTAIWSPSIWALSVLT